MSTSLPMSATVRRPARLLTQNSEMRQIGVWNWSLPAWAGRLPDGRTYNTCPSAGICAQACYARHGTYTWPVVRAKHQANLMYVLDDLTAWQDAMVAELGAAKFRDAWIRIHDSGDFFSDTYLQAWLGICRAHPDTNFYAYTKEVSRFRALVEPDPPPNFLWVYPGSFAWLSCWRDRVRIEFSSVWFWGGAWLGGPFSGWLPGSTGPVVGPFAGRRGGFVLVSRDAGGSVRW